MVEMEKKRVEEVEVEVVESGMVAPSEETPKHSIWLSNLDLQAPAYSPTVYYYRPNGDPGFFSPAAMKAALAKALVPFYPLAGRLVVGLDGQEEIQCTGDGALFVVARCESTLDDLGEAVPAPEVKKKLVPSGESGHPPCILVMFQVTFFKCGGVCLGTAIHHTATDGFASLHFINTWSDIARGFVVAAPPFLDRTVLCARSPPTPIFEHIEYTRRLHSKGLTGDSPSPSVIAILKLSKDQVNALKNGNGTKRGLSTFRAVAAHVWRCACKARELAGDQETRLFMPVDVRGRMAPPLPPGYLGNAFFRASVVSTVKDITSNPIEFGASKISETLNHMDDKYVRSLVDFIELQKCEGSLARGLWALRKTDFWVTSWIGLPIFDADFGWGKPEFMIRASLPIGGMVYIMNSPRRDGSVSLVVGFEPENMSRFKKILYEDLNGTGLGSKNG